MLKLSTSNDARCDIWGIRRLCAWELNVEESYSAAQCRLRAMSSGRIHQRTVVAKIQRLGQLGRKEQLKNTDRHVAEYDSMDSTAVAILEFSRNLKSLA